MAVYVRVRDASTLRARIAAARMTQARLALAAGMSPARISQITSGRDTSITVTAAAALERALNAEPGDLFEVTDPVDLVRPYVA